MQKTNLTTIAAAATYLNISEDLIIKFIKQGLITPIYEESKVKLTDYNFRRLITAVDLYEKCMPTETIEFLLNN